MIQSGSYLKVIDNSGAREVKCIGVLKRVKQRYAFMGEIITVSVKKLRTRRKLFSKVKKGEIYRALITRTKLLTKSQSGDSILFSENSVVLLNKQNKLIGTRVFGGIYKHFRYTKYLKFLFLAIIYFVFITSFT